MAASLFRSSWLAATTALLVGSCAAPDSSSSDTSVAALPQHSGARSPVVRETAPHPIEEPTDSIVRPLVPVAEPSDSLCDGPAYSPRTLEPKLEPEQRRVLNRYLAEHHPQELRPAGETRRVILWVCFDAQGQVQNTRVEQSSGDERFDTLAQQALRQVSFTPARHEEQPVPVWVQLPVNSPAGPRTRN